MDMNTINIITFIVGLLTFAFTVASFWNQLFNQIVEISARNPIYYDYDFGNNHYTDISIWIDNRGDSNITIKSAEYYYHGKKVQKGIPNSPTSIGLFENVMLIPGSHTSFGNKLPLKMRPDKLVIKFNKRISMFSKTLSINLKKYNDVNNA